MSSDKPTLEGVHDLLFGASKALALKLGLELELFSKIAAGYRTPDELAKATNSNIQGVRSLADALCGLGFLQKEGHRYAMTSTSEAFLVKGKQTYYGDSYLDAILPWAWDLDGPATQAIRKGQGVGKDITTPDSAALWESWSAAHATFYEEIATEARMMWDSVRQQFELKAGLRVLDVACGHAISTLVLLEDDIAVSATLIDQYPEVLKVAGDIADGVGVGNKVTLHEMSLFSLKLDSDSYDLAYIGGILYLLSMDQIIEVLARVRQSLSPEGLLVVNTMIIDEDRTDNIGPLIQGFRRFLYNGRSVPSYHQYEKALITAGFTNVKQHGENLVMGVNGG